MVEESQVVTRYAYVLFYRRRNSPVERPPRLLGPLGAESPTAAGATASQVRVPRIHYRVVVGKPLQGVVQQEYIQLNFLEVYRVILFFTIFMKCSPLQ